QHGDRDRGEWPLGESHSCATVRQAPSAPRRWLPGESHTCASVGEPPTSHRQWPSVTVALPTFNEPVANLRACVHSVLNQSYPGRIQVVVVDDGSDAPVSEANLELPTSRPTCGIPEIPIGSNTRSPAALGWACAVGGDCAPPPEPREVPKGYDGNRRCELISLAQNRGKRHAQKAAFDRAEGEYIVTADGDTVLHPDALSGLVNAMEAWTDAGAATASIRVRNTNSLFTTLLDLRYWSAFHQERASQSYFGVMICCGGPLSIYRRELVDALKHEYVNQRFLGKECTFGDDRHLTNLILREGWDTKFVPDAQAWTLAPERILKWLRQQRRWSQSFYRECWWSLRFMHRRNVYFGYNLLVGGLMPLFLAYGLIAAGVHVAQTHWWMAGKYVATVFLMAWIRGAYGLWLTRDWKFLLMPVYGLLHLVGVMPVRLYALFTLGNTSWGTRTAGALSGTGGTGFDGVWPISAEAQGSGK
ncbi:MAG: glycosyltransferase, partial [Planctomycetes bacterium]|nr:glycosyltransferase [Planctomycetota bacterium]